MVKRLPKPKVSEAELCRDFIAWAALQGWTAYAETGDFDLILVKDGIQIGVQAKLRFNATLLRQIIPIYDIYAGGVGPHYRAILLPERIADVEYIARFCGFTYFHPASWSRPLDHFGDFDPKIDIESWTFWDHPKRIELPDYVPDVTAGASAPRTLSRWKVGALRICAVLAIRGFVLRKDFDEFKVDPRRWTTMGWLKYDRENKRYLSGSELRFPQQHPQVYEQIVADLRKRVS